MTDLAKLRQYYQDKTRVLKLVLKYTLKRRTATNNAEVRSNNTRKARGVIEDIRQYQASIRQIDRYL